MTVWQLLAALALVAVATALLNTVAMLAAAWLLWATEALWPLDHPSLLNAGLRRLLGRLRWLAPPRP